MKKDKCDKGHQWEYSVANEGGAISVCRECGKILSEDNKQDEVEVS
jgi:ribosome-binding protein aMBF1 (putative translation factor)